MAEWRWVGCNQPVSRDFAQAPQVLGTTPAGPQRTAQAPWTAQARGPQGPQHGLSFFPVAAEGSEGGLLLPPRLPSVPRGVPWQGCVSGPQGAYGGAAGVPKEDMHQVHRSPARSPSSRGGSSHGARSSHGSSHGRRSSHGSSTGAPGSSAGASTLVIWGNVVNVELNRDWSLPRPPPGGSFGQASAELSDSASARSAEFSYDSTASVTSDMASSSDEGTSSTLKDCQPPLANRLPTVSQGSSEHESGRCRPCAWYWKVSGCSNGTECPFCHLCERDAIKARKRVKLRNLKEETNAAGPPTKRKSERKNLVSL